MAAGRELDALVAERVMGHGIPHPHQPPDGLPHERPHYSTDIASAWEVVAQMGRNGWPLYEVGALVTLGEASQHDSRAAFAQTWPPSWIRAGANSAPLAICRAALKAVGVSERRHDS
jgi:hypothetical protein